MPVGPDPPPHEDAAKSSRRRGTGAALGILLVAAATVRLVSLLSWSQLPWSQHPEVDAALYHEAGRAMARGDLLLSAEALHLNPGYPYFVGAVYALLGDGLMGLGIVQLLLGVGTVGLLWELGRMMFGPRWAFLPATVAAFYAPLIFYEGTRLAATLATFLFTLLLLLAVRFVRAPREGSHPSRVETGAERSWRWIASRGPGLGAVFGLAVIVRPNALALIPLLVYAVVVAVRERRRQLVLGLTVTAAALLMIAPIMARNVMLGEGSILLSSNGGINFFIGNGPDANGTFNLPSDLAAAGRLQSQWVTFERMAEDDVGHPLSAAAVDRYWLGRALRHISAHPLEWGALMVNKVWLFFNGRQLSNVFDYEFIGQVNDLLRRPLFQWSLVAPFALVGTLLLAFSGSRLGRCVALFNASACVGVVMFFVVARFRVPVTAGMLLAATATLRGFVRCFQTRDFGRLGALAGAVGLGVALTWPAPVTKRFDEQYYRMGALWHELDRHHAAESAYRSALQRNSDHLRAHYNLATLYDGAMYDRTKARRHWRRVYELADAEPRLRNIARDRLETLAAELP
jgi:4-amino-4-deoxy-L-arabinose transferase-like glycosyltransferase